MSARYQDPVRGQFISEDPVFLSVSNTDTVGTPAYATIGLSAFTGGTPSSQMLYLASPQAMNAYSYANDNPITYKDPDGKWGTPADYAGLAVGGATYVYLLTSNYYLNSQNGLGISGLFPTRSQVNTDLVQAFQAGSIVSGSRIIGAPFDQIAQAAVTGITTFSLLSGYDVTNGYVAKGGPGQIDYLNNGLQASVSYLQDLLPQPGNIYSRGRPSNMNIAIQPALRDTLNSTIPTLMSGVTLTTSGSNKSSNSSSGSGTATFSFGGFLYPKFFSGITTNGMYARIN